MAPVLTCPDCRSPMAHLDLPGHYGARVQLDHCDACRLLWFDSGEFGRLGREGWVQLLVRLVQPGGSALGRPSSGQAVCPVCQRGLQPVQDQTVFGRFQGLQCPAGHGRMQRDATLFASRGLFRRLLPLEREVLGERLGPCLGCGAPAQEGDCRFCGTPPLVIDLPRLAQGLGLTERRSTLGQGEALRWDCQGCGQPLDAASRNACAQCQHPVVALQWEAVGPLLEQAARVPARGVDENKASAAQAEALLAHERWKADWAREARPRSPAGRLLRFVARVLMSGRGR